MDHLPTLIMNSILIDRLSERGGSARVSALALEYFQELAASKFPGVAVTNLILVAESDNIALSFEALGKRHKTKWAKKSILLSDIPFTEMAADALYAAIG